MAFRGSRRTAEACAFHFQLESELIGLKRHLEAGTYRPRPYRYFRIREPKERTVSVASFRDRVVHHAVVGILEPIYERRFIHHSYATRKAKGTHRAVLAGQRFLRRYPFYLKADIEKYFESIDHGVILSQLEKAVKDDRLLSLIEVIVRNNDVSLGKADGKGLPIGNLTSQFFANVYLNEFDHFVLEKIRAGPYIRYMDDFVIFSDRKASLLEARNAIRVYLEKYLCLKLKEKATFINRGTNGLSFLGFRIFPNLLRLKRENVGRLRRKLAFRRYEFEAGIISEEKFRQSLASLFGHLEFLNSFRLRASCLANNG